MAKTRRRTGPAEGGGGRRHPVEAHAGVGSVRLTLSDHPVVLAGPGG